MKLVYAGDIDNNLDKTSVFVKIPDTTRVCWPNSFRRVFFGTLILCWILHAWVGRGRVGQWRSFACDHLCVFQQARTSRIGVGWDAFGPCCLVERGLIFGESGEYIFSIIYIYTYWYIYIIYTLGIRNASLHTRVALQAFRPTGPDCQSRAGPAN